MSVDPDYYNVAEVGSACLSLAQRFPHEAKAFALPRASHEQRTIHALEIGGPPNGKPVFMVIGGLHGNEWGSAEIILNLASDLLQGLTSGLDYGAGVTYGAAELQRLLQELTLVLLPLANPDGREASQPPGVDSRKNRRTIKVGGQEVVQGVDLNRNFDLLFGLADWLPAGAAVSGSGVPGHAFYRGTTAFGEPETANVRDLVECYQPSWFVDLHSGALWIATPWSVDQTQSDLADADQTFDNPAWHGQRGAPDDGYAEYMPAQDVADHRALAAVYQQVLAKLGQPGIPITPNFQFTACSGCSIDWVYSRHRRPGPAAARTLAFMLEWSATPVPRWSQMEPILGRVSAGLIAMSLATLPPLAPP